MLNTFGVKATRNFCSDIRTEKTYRGNDGEPTEADRIIAEARADPIAFHLKNLKEEYDLLCLDFGLYDVCVALNRRGFLTHSSCAGHRRGQRGGIGLCKQKIESRNMEDLLWILQRFGLKDIEVDMQGEYTVHVSFAAIEGSQYRAMTDMWPPWEDADHGHAVPPKPGKCPTCGKSDFWLQGEMYDIGDTLEWMCKHCQPMSFDKADMKFQTPEIKKRRAELPKMKLFEVDHEGKKFPYQIRAENEMEACYQLGYEPFDYDNNDRPYFTRIE